MGKYGLCFDTIESPRQLSQLADFLRVNPGSYNKEQHERWIEETCIPGVESGERTAIAWFQGGEIVGDAVLKIDDSEPGTVEIKNFRVSGVETMVGRRIRHAGDFMIVQALDEAVDLITDRGTLTHGAEVATVKLDATANNPIVGFFQRYGFEEVGRAELYIPGQTEVMMSRKLPLA